jgi:hypothetical protein
MTTVISDDLYKAESSIRLVGKIAGNNSCVKISYES